MATVTANITGLTSNTTYEFKVVITEDSSTGSGNTLALKTAETPNLYCGFKSF